MKDLEILSPPVLRIDQLQNYALKTTFHLSTRQEYKDANDITFYREINDDLLCIKNANSIMRLLFSES